MTEPTTFTTEPVESADEWEKLVVDSEIPDGASVTVTVRQDLDGDGDADVEESVDVSERQHEYELTQFEEGGHSYWLAIELEPADAGSSPEVQSVSAYASGEVADLA